MTSRIPILIHTLLLTLSWSIPGYAQSPVTHALDTPTPISQYGIETWTAEDGLPSNVIRSITQTPDGYLWLATDGGLARFDGVRFTVFDKTNTPLLSTPRFSDIRTAGDGSLWIGTHGGGLLRYRDGRFDRYTTADGLADDNVTALALDSAGELWLVAGTTIQHFQDGVFTRLAIPDSIAPKTISATLQGDSENGVWFGTFEQGLYHYRDGEWRVYTTDDGLTGSRVRKLAIDHQGTLWLWISGFGLNRFKDGRGYRAYVRDKRNNPITGHYAIYVDSTGALWADGAGLMRRRENTWEMFDMGQGLTDNRVRAIYEDDQGHLWVGTYRGLNKIKEGIMRHELVSDIQSPQWTTAVLQDREGTLWIGTFRDGLYRFKNGVYTRYTTRDGLVSNQINTLCEERPGRLLIGTDRGLIQFEDGVFTRRSPPAQGSARTLVRVLYVDRTGSLWMADGLSLYRSHNGLKTHVADGIFNWIHEDGEGILWFGASDGIYRFEDGRFTRHVTSMDLSNTNFSSCFEDADGTLWLSTRGKGLIRMDKSAATEFSVRDGLEDHILAVLGDDRGHLWLTTDQGILRVARQDLTHYAAGRLSVLPVVVYDRSDGLKSNEGNSTGFPEAWRDRDGMLWFTMFNGIVRIHPAALDLDQDITRRVMIEDLLADQMTVDRGAEVDIPPDINDIEIQYTAVDFAKSGTIRFKYRLEGYDNDWVSADTRRTAYYSNLAPGDYQFRVQASKDLKTWIEAEELLSFTVLPAWWETWWARFLGVAGLAGLILFGHRVRTHHIRIRNLTLEQEITERKMAEEELLKSEARFRSLMEQSPLAIESLTPQGQITMVNAAWMRLFGLNEEETAQVLEKYNMLTDGKQAEEHGVMPLIRKAFAGESVVLPPIHYSVRRTAEDIGLGHLKDKLVWIQCHLSPIKNPNQEIVFVVNTYVDITALRLVEQEVREQREVLARMDRATSMGQLTGSISHELNQPLTGILSNAQAAEMMIEYGQWTRDEMVEIMAEIAADAKRASEVIRNLRELYRGQKGEFHPVDINAVANETTQLLHSEFVMQQVVPTAEYASPVPMVDGNRIQIQQVLVNLIINGTQAMSGIARDDRRLHIVTACDANEVRAWVEDCGPGIDAEHIDRIFEPLATWKPGGTGMGLAISNSIIEAHGGRMWAENRPGGGARVGFVLPVLKEGRQT